MTGARRSRAPLTSGPHGVHRDGCDLARIEQLGEDVEAAFPPMSVTIHLEDDLDVSRGDLLCRPNNQPIVGQDPGDEDRRAPGRAPRQVQWSQLQRRE